MKYPAAFWLTIVFVFHLRQTNGNDFSSFLTSNASMAVIVDHEYMKQRGENILANFQKILSDTIRENLKNGGINVKYFTWNAVRLKKDFLAAMTVTDCENTWKFYKASRITSILLIAITDGDCPRLPIQHALMIPLISRGEEFSQMMLDAKIQKVLKWKTAIVLMDEQLLSTNDILVKSIVYESTSQSINPLSLQLYTINDTLRTQRKRTALRNLLQQFYSKQAYQFLIFSKLYEDIIEIAEGMNMFHIYNEWLFFIMEEKQRDFEAMSVTQNLEEGANIAFALNETLVDCTDTMNCTISEVCVAFVTSVSRIIFEEQTIQGKITDEEWETIRKTKEQKQDSILEYMMDYLIKNSKCSSCSRWRMQTAITWGKTQEHKKYRTTKTSSDSRNKNFEFVDVGFWSPLLGFITNELLFPHIEHHFRNITMNIVTTQNPPWQILSKNYRGVITSHQGITMEILKELSRMLNFTYVLYQPKTSETEEVVSNDTETLMGSLTHIIPCEIVALVQEKNFFLAAVASTIDEPDKKVFNYTMPISVQKYSFITRRPDEISRIYLFTAPFTLETWASLAAVILFTAPVLYFINRLVPMKHLKIAGLCKIKNCFWYIYGALLQQGGMYLPKADSGRLVIGVWWIVVIVLVTTYCGNLVAFLTFPKFQPGLDYLYQLFQKQGVQQFGLRNGTFFEKYAAITTRNDFRKYVERAIVYSNALNEGIDEIERGQRVNVDWRINLQLIIQNRFERDKVCKCSLGKESFLDEQIGLIVPSNSPYLNLINDKIMRMFQMGFIERWHQTNLPSMDKCNGKGILRAITNHKVNLDDMQGCFLVLLFGFILALLVILVEYWFHHFYALDQNKRAKKFAK